MAATELTYGEYVSAIRLSLVQNHRQLATVSSWTPAANFYQQILALDELCAPFVCGDLRAWVDARITGTPANPAAERTKAQDLLTAIKDATTTPAADTKLSPKLTAALSAIKATLEPKGAAYAILFENQSLLGSAANPSDAQFIFCLRVKLRQLFEKLHDEKVGLDNEATVIAGHLLTIDEWTRADAETTAAINTWINRPIGATEEPLRSLAAVVKNPNDQNAQTLAFSEIRAALLPGGAVRVILERSAPPVWQPQSKGNVICGYFKSAGAALLPILAGLLVLVLGLFILAVPNDCPPAGIPGSQLNLGWAVSGPYSANRTKGNPLMCAVPLWRKDLSATLAASYNLLRDNAPEMKLDEPSPKQPETKTQAAPTGPSATQPETKAPPAPAAPSTAPPAPVPPTVTQTGVSAPATADQAGNWIKAAGSELKARLAWIISYASQLLATFAAIVITFWIIAVAIEDQVNPVGCGGSAVQWLRQAVLWFCLAAIAVAIVAAFIEYSIIHGLFRGSVKHVPVHAIFTSPQDNLQWFLEERLMPGIRRLLRPAGYALNLAVIGLIAATSMTLLQAPDMPARRRTGNDLPYEQYLTRCFQRLTLAIYIGAVLLALSVVQVGARHSWPLSLISGDPNKLLQDAVGQLGLLYGTIFSLFLVALYGPAVVILRRRAWQLVRATEPTGTTTTHTQWLTERNLSFTL